MIRNLYSAVPKTVIIGAPVKRKQMVFVNLQVSDFSSDETEGIDDGARYQCYCQRYLLTELTLECLLEAMPGYFLLMASEEEIAAIMEAFDCADDIGAWRLIRKTQVTAYDSGDVVNQFTLNGNKGWWDKSTRVGLVNMYTIFQSNTVSSSAIPAMWLNGKGITVTDTNDALGILTDLEVYAAECYSITQQLLAAVATMELGELKVLDFRSHYPTPLVLEI